ncbi:unnamed protein product [Bursaphelenchus okinawaensis]|uniref:RNA helicase n=1 Tax=Bursaphelenchus okinawaensis TaxID=465554 RepID=A0A811JUE3_9BILA|nr:unnamed protein product [Bursaphelenchus okinawaensis]CAG9084242.1 unnamed protein product [Bursaphelenchus okinawaensis]
METATCPFGAFGDKLGQLSEEVVEKTKELNVFGKFDEARKKKKAALCGEKVRMNARMSTRTYGLKDGDVIDKGPLFEVVETRKERKIRVETDATMEKIYPIQSFAEAGFYYNITTNAMSHGYRKPTAIQSYAIPYLLKSRRDILARADTGSGKTAAFLLPALDLVRKWKLDTGETRELALQVYRDALAFCRGTGLRICLAIGEVHMLDSLRMIQNGCDIVIGTQGRVVHYFFGIDNKGTMAHLNFRNLRWLVLDEVDRVLQDPNYNSMLKKFTKKFATLPNPVRTIMFSATLDLESIGNILKEDHYRIICGDSTSPVDTIVQAFVQVNTKKGQHKTDYLLRLMQLQASPVKSPSGSKTLQVPKTIIYLNKKRVAEYLCVRLLMSGFRALPLSGDLPMHRRISAVEKMKNDEIDVLIATDVASRGLNIPNVHHVINYDLPLYNFFEYVHRIGRCGRMGHVGRATSFYDPFVDREICSFLKQVLLQVHQPVPDFIEKAAKDVDLSYMGEL